MNHLMNLFVCTCGYPTVAYDQSLRDFLGRLEAQKPRASALHLFRVDVRTVTESEKRAFIDNISPFLSVYVEAYPHLLDIVYTSIITDVPSIAYLHRPGGRRSLVTNGIYFAVRGPIYEGMDILPDSESPWEKFRISILLLSGRVVGDPHCKLEGHTGPRNRSTYNRYDKIIAVINTSKQFPETFPSVFNFLTHGLATLTPITREEALGTSIDYASVELVRGLVQTSKIAES